MSIALKRAYEAPASKDGRRILVDRVWPRGVSKEELHLDGWFREVAPSTQLRKWFGHDPERWSEFEKRYRAELRKSGMREPLEELAAMAKRGKVTLVYGAHDEEYNQAVVLRDYLKKLIGTRAASKRKTAK
ncbi:MAG TPA: DUF488 domain-containing protein [Candidatus Baltobacteraceae bacterium]|nr:DUF488 domain-containing protein [Candidatus Baltobacteraceae bacterium]